MRFHRRYLSGQAAADFWQITAAGTKDYRTADGIRVCPAVAFLRQLA